MTFNSNQWPLWTALITPLDANGNVHFADFEKLLRIQDAANIGILILGSTGEALNLNLEERKEVVAFTQRLKLKSPVMVGVGGSLLSETLEWLDFCESLNVDAFLMPTPLYAKPGPVGQRQWFETLMNRVSKPCMLYNIPSRAGVALSRDALKDLEHHPRLWALKEASGSVVEFEKYARALPRLEIYSGDDGMLPFYYPLGVKGLVSVASNIWPAATKTYVHKVLTGDVTHLLDVWTPAVNALFEVSNPVPVKVGMHTLGMIETPNLRAPLTHMELKSTQNILRAHEEIQSWQGVNHV